MNNYSGLQKWLHRRALASQLMRETMYDLEKSIFLDKNSTLKENHVFVAGLARSGTTALLNALYETGEFASLSYEDMPFILAPNLWSKVNRPRRHGEPVERAHGDGIKVTTKSPEAFEEVFWRTFHHLDDSELCEEIRRYISVILTKKKKSRYLSKNNQNVRRVLELQKCFSGSKILIPFREPIQQAYSLLSQHKKFSTEQQYDPFTREYMNLIGHSEFGMDYRWIVSGGVEFKNDHRLNHWLEQWYLVYKYLLDLVPKSTSLCFVCYEDLCDNHQTWQALQSFLNIERPSEFIFRNGNKAISEHADKDLLARSNSLYNLLKAQSVAC